jgi:hypothetical protein
MIMILEKIGVNFFPFGRLSALLYVLCHQRKENRGLKQSIRVQSWGTTIEVGFDSVLPFSLYFSGLRVILLKILRLINIPGGRRRTK